MRFLIWVLRSCCVTLKVIMIYWKLEKLGTKIDKAGHQN